MSEHASSVLSQESNVRSADSTSALSHESSDVTRTVRTAGAAHVDALDRVRRALSGLRYGSVTIQVQDGVVVLIERVEKVRVASDVRAV